MKGSKTDIDKVCEDFFTHRGWQRKQCPTCLEDYYTKRDLPNCGSYRCAGDYTFLDIPAPKSYLEFGACLKGLREFFNAQGYPTKSPIEIIRRGERTLFASTAGQVYDKLIYEKTNRNETTSCIILQPVIRLQGISLVGSIEGISTSFVHAATEFWNANSEEHFHAFDRWLDFFSILGLHVGGFCLKTKRANNEWSGNIVISEMLKVNYSGLEIGVANLFLNIPQTGETIATLSDIGVGVERLMWAINKSLSYFDGIGPLSHVIITDRVTLDAIRTATLMAASGVVPTHKNHGSKLRAMIGLMASSAQRINLYELVRYYYRQWASLIALSQSRERTYAIIQREIDRNANLVLNRALGTDELFDQKHEEFLRSLVRKKIISISRLREILRRII